MIQPKTKREALQEFVFHVKLCDEILDLVKELGYEYRGRPIDPNIYHHKDDMYISICPLRKWYWFGCTWTGILVDVEEIVIHHHKLQTKVSTC